MAKRSKKSKMGESELANVGLPTRADLRVLPRWARVAYAARCAQRVQPLFVKFWPNAPERHVDAINRAIALSVDAAAAPTRANVSALKIAARNSNAAAFAVNLAYAKAELENRIQGHPEDVAACAAKAVAAALTAARSNSRWAGAESAFGTAQLASLVSVNTLVPTRLDLELLHGLARSEGWTDKTAVDAARLGTLWPFGMPEGWPEDARERRVDDVTIEIEIDVPDDATDEEVVAMAAKAAAAASRVNYALGGNGLRLRSIDVEQNAAVPGGVLS